jgi:Anti-sigma-28 factor, FlgM
MTIHAPCVLKGPVTRERPWWARPRRTSRRRPTAGVRTELVARVRREIAAGTYDTPQKWDAALERLAQSLCGE